MPLFADRVKCISLTPGTGPLTLEPVAGFRPFSVFGAVAGVRYQIEQGVEWEIGIGTVSVSPPTLTRDTVELSSNSDAAVNFTSAEKTVFCALAALDVEGFGGIDISDGGAPDTIESIVVGTGLSLSVAGDEATISVLDSGTGPSGGSLISGAEILVEADNVGGASNGAGVTSWPDQSGNGYDFAEATNPPTYRSADAGDGLPYLEFDGSNDVLQAIRTAGLVAQTDFTVYYVMRWTIQAASKSMLAFSQSGEASETGIRPYLQATNTGVTLLAYDGVTYAFNSNNDHRRFGDWQAGAFRVSTKMGRGHVLHILGGLSLSGDKGTGGLPTADFDRIRLGAHYTNFGNAGSWAVCDVRAFGLYLTAHSDVQVRSMLGYLRDKWAADLFRAVP